HRGPRVHRNRSCVEGRDRRVSQGARSGDQGSHAIAQCRRSRRRRGEAGQLGPVRGLDAGEVTGPDRRAQGLRRAGRKTEVNLPAYADVESAARQIAAAAHKTPVATSRSIDQETGAHVFFKCENLQRAGAFKFRGAYNALSRLNPDERSRGVVTFSSGNHAQAIALAGQLLGIPRVIVMPSDAPSVKRLATEGYGGEVVLYDRDREDREAMGKRLATERGLTLIPPYDHPHIIAGQGTAARELIEEVGALDAIYCPCGG